MPKGRIELVNNFTGETGKIILVWRTTAAPLAEIGRVLYNTPHSQRSLLIENLQPVMHTVTAYRSSDGTALDTEINVLAVDASNNAQFPIERFEYIVDRGSSGVEVGEEWEDPTGETNTLRDARLKDKYYWIEERGTASLLTTEITDRSDVGGGFDLNDGKLFHTDGVYVATVITRVNADTDSSTVTGGDYGDVVLMTSDLDYDAALHNGKTLISAWEAQIVGQLNMPNKSTLPNSKFKVNTHSGGGVTRNTVIQFDTGDTVWFRGEEMNSIILGVGEKVEILILENVFYILDGGEGYERVGDRVLMDAPKPNAIALDGTQFPQAEVPRLMWWIGKLNAAQIVTEAQWATSEVIDGDTVFSNHGKFAVDNVAHTVRVPNDLNMFYRALASIDPTATDVNRQKQSIGGYQHDKVHTHTHLTKTGFFIYKNNGKGNLSSNNDAVRNEDANRSNDGLQNFGGNETTPVNRGLLPYLII